MILFISSLRIINATVPYLNIFLWIAASVADASAVNPNCILCNWDFDNFILADEQFGKPLWSLEACLLVNNDLGSTLVSSLDFPINFHEIFKVYSVPFFIPHFHLWSCKLVLHLKY